MDRGHNSAITICPQHMNHNTLALVERNNRCLSPNDVIHHTSKTRPV